MGTPDMTNPSHYREGSTEVIDFIRQQLGDEGFIAYCRGNALKYLSRAGKKEIAGRDEDAAKARWYSQMAVHVMNPGKLPDPREYRSAPPA